MRCPVFETSILWTLIGIYWHIATNAFEFFWAILGHLLATLTEDAHVTEPDLGSYLSGIGALTLTNGG